MSKQSDKQSKPIAQKIVALLERLSTAVRAVLQETATAEKLTPIQVEVLLYLQSHSDYDVSMSDLVNQFQVAQPTISDVVRVLNEKGFIEIRPAARDARLKLLSLSGAGNQTAHRLLGHNARLLGAVESMSETDLTPLFEQLLRIAHAFRTHDLITVDKMCLTCRFFESSQSASRQYYCRLLNIPLDLSHIRIDCPEHEPKRTTA